MKFLRAGIHPVKIYVGTNVAIPATVVEIQAQTVIVKDETGETRSLPIERLLVQDRSSHFSWGAGDVEHHGVVERDKEGNIVDRKK